jgi:hypothetical protein
MVLTPVDLDSLSKAELKERHLDLLEQFCALEEQMMALKDELARLKGGSGRPPIKPSGMERSSEGRQAKVGQAGAGVDLGTIGSRSPRSASSRPMACRRAAASKATRTASSRIWRSGRG